MNRRDFVRGAMTAGMVAGVSPGVLQASTSNPSPEITPNPYVGVDPELVPALKEFTTLISHAEILSVARKHQPKPALPAPAPQAIERRIPGPKGAPELRLVIVDPAPGTKGRPAFLHIHGGGQVAGQDIPFLQKIAQACGYLVVQGELPAGAGDTFPDSLEDNYARLRWLYETSEALGVDRKRIAVGGESAGGGHSACLAIAARDRKEIPILFHQLRQRRRLEFANHHPFNTSSLIPSSLPHSFSLTVGNRFDL